MKHRYYSRLLPAIGIAALMLIASPLMAQMQRSGQPGTKQGEMRGPRQGHMPFMEDLTEEQRAEVKSLIESMQENDATRKEIRTAINELLASWGIEPPEAGARHPRQPFMEDLTEEQRAEMKSLIESMQAEDATREEMRTAVGELLASWGIEPPEAGARHPRQPFMSDLTEEQRAEMKSLIESMQAEDATRKEIRTAVGELLASWGIEPPEAGARHPRQPFMEDLTEEQRAEMKSLIESMQAEDATREEIRTAVNELLESWGVEPPARGPRHGFMNELDTDQRTEVRELIKSMRADDASREEIRAAVNDLLESWGIEPSVPGHESSQQADEQNELDAELESGLQMRNYPNPFNPTTTISYTLEKEAQVTVKVFNIQGQLVRSLVDGMQIAGTHQVQWDGLDQNHNSVPSGTYIYRVESDGQSLTRQMVLLK